MIFLIALHGHGSDRWQYIKDPRDECRVARDVAAGAPDALRVARLPGMYLVDGAQGGGRPAANPRRAEGPLPDRQGGPLRRLDGRIIGPDLRRAPSEAGPRRGLDERHGQPRAVRQVPGRDRGLLRRQQAAGPRAIQEAVGRVLAGALNIPLGVTAGGKDQLVPAASVSAWPPRSKSFSPTCCWSTARLAGTPPTTRTARRSWILSLTRQFQGRDRQMTASGAGHNIFCDRHRRHNSPSTKPTVCHLLASGHNSLSPY